MGSNMADEVMISGVDGAESSETTVEIKIKTLDSQTYTLRVNKRIGVPELKEQIETVTGVLSAQQRLICRGKVLKDDQLLSAYHVEDGHTLHLVVRQPFSSSASTMSSMGSESLPDHPATDPALNTVDNRGHVAHSVVLGTFNVGDHGDGGMPDLNRIVSAVLSSIGITNIGSEGMNIREHGPERNDGTSGASDTSVPAQLDPDQNPARVQFDSMRSTSRLPTTSLSPMQPPVIPDSLTTLSHYLSRLRSEFAANVRGQSNNARAAGMHSSEGREHNATLPSARPGGLPSPASLAEVMMSTRGILIDQAGECLHQISNQLQDQVNVTHPSVRSSFQTSAMETGVLLQNLGALLLELGRTTMTLRMGHTPLEAVVNAGPAVFISTTGPNPIMVQPLPFQPGLGYGSLGTANPGGLVSGSLGSGFFPRNIDIRIRTGSSMSTSANRDDQVRAQQIPGGTDSTRSSDGAPNVNQAASGAPSFNRDSVVRMVPIRTVVAAVPTAGNRTSSESSGSSVGMFYPLLARVQHVTPGQSNSARGSQATGERHPSAPETDRQNLQQPNMTVNSGAAAGGSHSETAALFSPPTAATVSEPCPSNTGSQHHQQGSMLNLNSRWQEPSNSNHISTPSCTSHNGQESIQQFSCSSDLHRTNCQREQINGTNQVLPPNSAMGQGSIPMDADRHDSVPSLSLDEGIFLSRLLRQLMPLISQTLDTEPNNVQQQDTSEHQTVQESSAIHKQNRNDVGTSHRRKDSPPPSPGSKRQKRA